MGNRFEVCEVREKLVAGDPTQTILNPLEFEIFS